MVEIKGEGLNSRKICYSNVRCVRQCFQSMFHQKTLNSMFFNTSGTVLYSTVQYSTVQYSTVKCSAVQYSTVQYSTAQYSPVQSSTVRYSTVPPARHAVTSPGACRRFLMGKKRPCEERRHVARGLSSILDGEKAPLRGTPSHHKGLVVEANFRPKGPM